MICVKYSAQQSSSPVKDIMLCIADDKDFDNM